MFEKKHKLRNFSFFFENKIITIADKLYLFLQDILLNDRGFVFNDIITILLFF